MANLPNTASNDTASLKELDLDLRSEIAELYARFDALRYGAATLTASNLRDAQTATLAGLQRPEPIDAMPDDLGDQEHEDYLILARSALFDSDWYRRTNPDIAAAGVDPVLHYLRYGWRERRHPGPAFDGTAYLAANADVDNADINPLVHFHRFGSASGRSLSSKHSRDRVTSRFVISADPLCIVADIRSRDEYLAFQISCPFAFSDEAERLVLDHVRLHGTETAFSGHSGSEHTAVIGTDLREHLFSAGMTSRNRAVCETILETLIAVGLTDDEARIYGHEAITDFAKKLRARFIRYVGSEYAPTAAGQRALFPILHNDICRSRFDDDMFDVTFSCDVLEHVADIDAALRETARTLASGGRFIATLPFDYNVSVGWRFADICDGRLVHLLDTPIYHGNPMDPEGGSLVFEIPGWDIIQRAITAGFSDAAMRFICDQKKGIVASPEGDGARPRGVFVLICTK